MSLLAGDVPPETVAVIGGGLIGLSIAWHLSRGGVRVKIFETGELGSEASWAGAGMLAPGGEVEDLSLLSRLAIESRKLYPDFVRDLERDSGLTVDFQECGALELAYSSTEWEVLQLRAARQREIGIPNKPVTASRVTTFWPRLRTVDLAGAFFYPDDAIVNPRELVLALTAACRTSGVEITQHSGVLSIDVSSGETIVTSGQGSASFRAAVVAAGAWSSMIAVRGVPPLPSAHPVKGHLIGYQQPDQTCSTIVRHGHLYVLQRASGLLIAGASVEHVGFSREIDPSVAQSLVSQAGWLIPHLAETTPSEIWAGFRPGSDALQLGAWHSPRLFLAYGHYRNGILLAPVTGRDLAVEIIANSQKL